MKLPSAEEVAAEIVRRVRIHPASCSSCVPGAESDLIDFRNAVLDAAAEVAKRYTVKKTTEIDVLLIHGVAKQIAAEIRKLKDQF